MRYFLILLTALGLSACSYSPEQLRQSYSDLGKSYANDLKQSADFDADQRRQIDQFGMQIQQWHRTQKLPVYAAVMTRMGTQLQQNSYIPGNDLYAFIDLLQGFPHFHQASAANYQLGVMAQTLNDAQLAQLSADLHHEQREQKAEIRSRTPEIRQHKLVKTVAEITGYLGVELTKSQLDIVREFAPGYHDLGEARIAVNERWDAQLVALLKQRQHDNFPRQFALHMQRDNEHALLMQQEPQLVQANRQQTRLLLEALIASMDNTQKASLASHLLSIGATFAEMTQEQ